MTKKKPRILESVKAYYRSENAWVDPNQEDMYKYRTDDLVYHLATLLHAKEKQTETPETVARNNENEFCFSMKTRTIIVAQAVAYNWYVQHTKMYGRPNPDDIFFQFDEDRVHPSRLLCRDFSLKEVFSLMKYHPVQRFRHVKSGGLYVLTGVGFSTGKQPIPQVIYVSEKDDSVWIRPLEHFFEKITLPSGKISPRFVLVGECKGRIR